MSGRTSRKSPFKEGLRLFRLRKNNFSNTYRPETGQFGHMFFPSGIASKASKKSNMTPILGLLVRPTIENHPKFPKMAKPVKESKGPRNQGAKTLETSQNQNTKRVSKTDLRPHNIQLLFKKKKNKQTFLNLLKPLNIFPLCYNTFFFCPRAYVEHFDS